MHIYVKNRKYNFTEVYFVLTELLLNGGSVGCKAAVALGIFDGLHRGHAQVIGLAASLAEAYGIATSVFTFKTSTVTTKGRSYSPIYSDEVKLSLLGDMGVEYVLMPDFTELCDYSPEEFVRKVLADKLKAEFAVCGADFRLGKGASCGADKLAGLCERYGIKLKVAPDVTDKLCGRISSAQIREFIRSGEIASANRLLGRAYAVEGEVIEGNRFGRTLSFPTVNQHMNKNAVMPLFGVYASEADIAGVTYRGVTNIGVKPTVDDCNIPLAETHFPLYSGDLYGKKISVRLYKFIRPEIKFSCPEELKDQIEKDKNAVMAMSRCDYCIDTL